MARILAIDYGTKRVGLAVTDQLQIIANTLTTIHAKDAIQYLKEYLAKEEVECFVVGKPMKMDGSNSESAVHVEKFINLLRKNFPTIPIERMDERFTSVMAKRTLLEMGLNKKDRANKSSLDQISAAIILQSFLETKTNNS
ncbi:MAG: Holliday junction resolvase RuvX [Bacteroidota bacterium]|jgi:putative holliday junction resolvase